MNRLDISDLAKDAVVFQEELNRRKRGMKDVSWYPYDSLGTVFNLSRMLTGEQRHLLDLIGSDTVLDLGCGDGDMSFFFERQGCKVSAADRPRTNFNSMAGVRAMRKSLESKLEIFELDLNDYFELPRASYGLTLAMGVLYHLENPMYFLRQVSRKSKYLLLSTILMEESELDQQPVAYLLGEDDLNQDATNYWLFSDKGFRQLLDRCRWDICDYQILIPEKTEHGIAPQRRVFCLAKSRYGQFNNQVVRETGWFDEGEEDWRWTEGSFSVLLTDASRSSELVLETAVLAEQIAALGPISISANADGERLGEHRITHAGIKELTFSLPMDVKRRSNARIEFTVDKIFHPGNEDCRELGVIVTTVGLR